MKKAVIIVSLLLTIGSISAQKSNIYKDGWIDFNKNGKKDIFEDPEASIDARVADLLSPMTTDEKTCQLVTLYGSG